MRPTKVYQFGHFKLNTVERLLLRDDRPVALTPKAFETLVALVSRGGHLVEKEELLNEVWPDTFVEESNLSRIIYLLRKALEEDAEESKFIETVPRRGYRFIAPVEEHSYEDSPDLILRQQRTSRAHIIIEEETSEPPAAPEAATATVPAAERTPQTNGKTKLKLLAPLALAVALLSGATYTVWRNQRQGQEASLAGIKKIAVLPFKPLGVEGSEELTGLGMADAIINKLTASHLFSVLPTSTVYNFTKRDYNPVTAGQELGVEAVLNGTVQRAGNRVRVTAQLIDVRNGQTVWSEKFDSADTDLFKLQDSISEQLAGTLSRQMTADQRAQLKKWSTANKAAYEAYLLGIYFYNQRTEEGLAKAISYFEKAIELDANYARAYAGLSDSLALSVYYGFQTEASQQTLRRAREAAEKALALDPNLAEAHMALGGSQTTLDRDSAAALASYQKAIALNPSFATAYQRYGYLLFSMDRQDEAVQAMRRAQELDPLSKTNNLALSALLYFTRHYEEAIKYCQKAIELDPTYAPAALNLGDIYAAQGMYPEALKLYRGVTGPPMESVSARESIAYVEAATGHQAEARRMLAEAENNPSEKQFISPLNFAMTYAAMGDKERAFAWLQRGSDADNLPMFNLLYDPRLDGLRADPGFEKFLAAFRNKSRRDRR